MSYVKLDISAVLVLSLWTNARQKPLKRAKFYFGSSVQSLKSPWWEDLIVMATRKYSQRFSYYCGPGNHETTFEGNPLVLDKSHFLKMG